MQYSSNLDEKFFTKSWESEFKRLTIGVYSYNKGPKKLQISRENKNSEGDFRFARLGRLSKEEVQAVLPLLQEALNHMD